MRVIQEQADRGWPVPKQELPEFVIDEAPLQFQCSFGVFPKGDYASICYCTDEARAKLVCEALNFYRRNNKGDTK